jgi:hypothetical protein
MGRKIKEIKRFFRIRRKNREFFRLFQDNLDTPALACRGDAQTEVHSATSHFHLPIYILAVKSLLRFYDQVAIVVHDDGSLTNKDQNLLKEHIRGIRVIPKDFADKEIFPALKQSPYSQKYRRKSPQALQLFDYAFFSQTEKIVSLDSDTLFFQEPQRLIEWINKDENKIIFSFEEKPYQQEEFLHAFGCSHLPQVNIGLVCFYKDIVDFGLIESILFRQKKGYWFIAQNIFPILAEKKSLKYRSEFFSKYEYQLPPMLDERAILKHYLSSLDYDRGYMQYKADAEIIIQGLKAKMS